MKDLITLENEPQKKFSLIPMQNYYKEENVEWNNTFTSNKSSKKDMLTKMIKTGTTFFIIINL